MDIALWIVQGVLAAFMLMAGIMKLAKPREELVDKMAFAEDFSDGPIKAIGALEVLAAIGLILPGITGIAPVLVPLAAVGIALIQAGAVIVHARRSETKQLIMNLVFIAMAVFIAWGRLGDYAL
jgi:uncharacterized membrane protein YphA (DoxX/SURF4 family)